MQALQRQASCMSGVSQEDAAAIDHVNLYERLGFDTFVQLSTNFYTNVYSDEQQWFRSLFANTTKDEAIQNQSEYFIQRMGGPPLYAQRKGTTALIARHGPYPITERAAARWLYHMKSALDQTVEIDMDSRTRMFNFFKLIPKGNNTDGIVKHMVVNSMYRECWKIILPSDEVEHVKNFCNDRAIPWSFTKSAQQFLKWIHMFGDSSHGHLKRLRNSVFWIVWRIQRDCLLG